ncbi:unnamed protein product [Meganyctiphanes norvegica]|uniref:Rhythmically expressed gene 5 protein n=1 Tax=Meganyctiphanes norvegica TaxID=48144 RepID=A0AAV2QJE0_MEGNR
MQPAKFLVFLALSATAYGSPNVPIWEMLTHQEKMGRLMYVFIHLVDNYCKGSSIPDCNKVLTLYGMSNLVNEDDSVLDTMDPYQRNSRIIIWEKVMRGDFKLPPSKSFYSNSIDEEVRAEEDYDYANEVRDGPSYQVNQKINKITNNPHPYAVRVPAPAKIAAEHASRMAASNSARSSLDIVEDSKTDNADIAVGSSHPYAVKVLPEATKPEPIPVGIKASGDYEPMMMESQVHEARVLPPTLTILTRTRRTAGDEFPEEEMNTLLSHVLYG